MSTNFAVPASASGTTRMRVSMQYNSVSAACGSFQYGEVEDYTGNIASSPLKLATILL